MTYTRRIYDKAKNILQQRREDAEYRAKQRHDTVAESHPEILVLEKEMADAGLAAIKAIGMGANAKSYIESLAEKNLSAQAKRAEILRSMGLPEDYLTVSYTCKICEDKGFVDGKMCECHRSLLRQLSYAELCLKAPLEKSTFENFELKYYPVETDPKFKISPKAKMGEIYEYCRNYADDFSSKSESIFMYGATGLGKTHLSLAIAGEVIKKGYGVIYGSAQNLLSKLENERFGRATADDVAAEDAVLECDLLIIDDLGAEFTTSFTVAAVYNIINTRILEGKPTIISTNLSLKELEDKYTQRITSRIIGNYTSLFFCGKDIRQQKIK
ncbi:MAG: ATP-binding protein [Clostridia bacterium]|nr:ATP-binding protein [Clostridia bacterium]